MGGFRRVVEATEMLAHQGGAVGDDRFIDHPEMDAGHCVDRHAGPGEP